MLQKLTQVNNPTKPTKKSQLRDLDLGAKVAKLEDDALVGPREVSALTGIARSSFQKKKQREKIGMPLPLSIGGRHLVWPLGKIRHWISKRATSEINLRPKSQAGRPTKATQLARSGAI